MTLVAIQRGDLDLSDNMHWLTIDATKVIHEHYSHDVHRDPSS